jgi:hypothetical protein
MGSIFRKGSEQTGQSGALSNMQGYMAQALFDKTNPLRINSTQQLNYFLENGVIPKALQSTVGLGVPIAQQEAELATAKRGIMDSLPRGGLQQRALMELPLQRLLQRDMFTANRNAIDDATRQNFYHNAVGTAMGAPAQAISGISSAAGNLKDLGAQRMNQNYQAQQGIGKTLGSAGMLVGGYMMPAMGASSLGGQKKGAN